MEYSVNSYRKIAVKQRFSDLKEITEETTKYVSDSSLEVTTEFKRACTEVMAVLSNTKADIKEEIPKNMFLFLAANEDVEHKNELDLTQDIDSLELSEKAILLISIIYRSYLCPNKEALDEILLKNDKKKKKKKIEDVDESKETEFKFSKDSYMEAISERERINYLNGLENFDSLDDFLDDEYEFNKFLDERENNFEKDLSVQEKINLKKIDRKTRKRARKEMDLFENRLETLDFKAEKQRKKEKSLFYKLTHKAKKTKKEPDSQKLLKSGIKED